MGNIILITEETGDINETLINLATLTGKITFSTRDFGRGTNFICRDRGVQANGGIHII